MLRPPSGRDAARACPRAACVLLTLAVAVARVPAARAAPDPPKKALPATRLRDLPPPRIDGRLDDRAWGTAAPDRSFTQNFPDEGKAPTQPTELYVLYDDQMLYLGLRCHDDAPAEIVERLTRRDRETDSDKVQIDLDSRLDGVSAYHFEVNAGGVLVDGLRFSDTEYNGDWDGLWEAAAAREHTPGATSWTAEIAIPWRTLRFAGAEPVMGLQVRRIIQRRGEIDAWVVIPRDAKAEVSRYGRLTGLSGLAPKRLFQLVPYVGGRVTFVRNQGAQDGNDLSPSAGLDLKLGVSSSLTLDATINPDFGQVEADQVVLNLSTFEIFYPEKRPFFLEGADLFATMFNQFYTRRIGHAPPAPVLEGTEDIVESPLAGRIWGAAKLSGQIVPHLSIAALEALTAEQTAVVITSSGAQQRRLIEPLANYAVLRLRSDWGSSFVGAMATAVDRFERGAGAWGGAGCPNDLTPTGDALLPANGRCTHDAYTIALDGRWLTGDGAYGAQAHVIGSRVERGPTRLVADGTRIGGGDMGLGVQAAAGKQGGEPLRYFAWYQGISPRLDLNDAGYLKQQNLHEFIAAIGLARNHPLGRLLEANANLWSYHKLSWTGVRLWDEVGVEAWGRFASFWQVYLNFTWHFQHWDNRETRDGALVERPPGWEVHANLKSDPRRRLFAVLALHGGSVEHGLWSAGDLTVSLRPLPQIELDLIPRVNWTYGDPRWAYQTDVEADSSRRYWFGNLDSRSFDVTVRGTYTFTPRLSLQLYAQIFVAGYHFTDFQFAASGADPLAATLRFTDFTRASPGPSIGGGGYGSDGREGAVNLNVVLRWEYRPGSTLLAVYTRAQGQLDYSSAEGSGVPSFRPFRGGPSTDVALLKLSYLIN